MFKWKILNDREILEFMDIPLAVIHKERSYEKINVILYGREETRKEYNTDTHLKEIRERVQLQVYNDIEDAMLESVKLENCS
jgi:hypothetical protein